MKKNKLLGGAALLGAALAGLVLSPAHAAPLDKMDIAGVRIGMTEAEALRAIKSFEADATAKRVVANFPYFDGVDMLQTPDFLDRLEIKTKDSGFGVWFTSPPAEPRVMAVTRRSALEQPPGSEQLLSSLTAKYGPVSARSAPRPGGHTVAHWSEDGKPQCTVDKDRNGQPVPWNNAMGTLLLPNGATVLEQYGRQRVPPLVAALGATPDVARCGTVLRYEWISEPVRSFEAMLIDQGGMVTTNRRSAQWVEQLKADAVRKRQGQGKAPKL